jgi:hypothetical protein
MTVEELIKRLERYPPKQEVTMERGDFAVKVLGIKKRAVTQHPRVHGLYWDSSLVINQEDQVVISLFGHGESRN